MVCIAARRCNRLDVSLLSPTLDRSLALPFRRLSPARPWWSRPRLAACAPMPFSSKCTEAIAGPVSACPFRDQPTAASRNPQRRARAASGRGGASMLHQLRHPSCIHNTGLAYLPTKPGFCSFTRLGGRVAFAGCRVGARRDHRTPQRRICKCCFERTPFIECLGT